MCLDVSLMDVSALVLQTMEKPAQFVLTHFAELGLLCCRKSAIHEVGMKAPQCYWDTSVDPLMLLLTAIREQIFTKSMHWGTSLCQMRGWAPEIVIYQQKKCVEQCQDLAVRSQCLHWVFSLWDVLLVDWKNGRGSKLEGSAFPWGAVEFAGC